MRTHRVLAGLALATLVAGCGGTKKTVKDGEDLPLFVKVLPAETKFVAGLSVAQLRTTGLYQRVVPMFRERLEGELGMVRSTCGIDVEKDVESVILATLPGEGADFPVVLVKGRWDEPKVSRCVVALFEKRGVKVAVKQDKAGGRTITVYDTGDGNPPAAAWVAPDTFLLAPVSQQQAAVLAGVLGRPGKLRHHASFMAVLGKVDTSATAFGAAVNLVGFDPAGTRQNAREAYFSISYGRTFDARGGFTYATPQAATDAAAAINAAASQASSGNPQLGDYMKGLAVRAEGSDVVMTLALDERQLESLVGMVHQQLGLLLLMGGTGAGPTPPEPPPAELAPAPEPEPAAPPPPPDKPGKKKRKSK